MNEERAAASQEIESPTWTIGQLAALACTQEVCAPKPGNVHRGADFDDLTVGDFLISGLALVPVFDRASQLTTGTLVLEAIRATRSVIASNTNLGIVLLFAPLAKAFADFGLCDRTTVVQTLERLGPHDSQAVYEAIRLAAPGGLGETDEMDVTDSVPPSLLAAMAKAAERDWVARQYATQFADLFEQIVPGIETHLDNGMVMSEAIVFEHVRCMARRPDSLIVRKCGADTGQVAQEYAAAVLKMGRPGDDAYHQGLANLDFWLRSDGRRRNPGTSADLVCAALFAGLLQQRWRPGRWR